jgi:undecaprenyl-diphosphatase
MFKVVLLGIIQGLTEFFPVSSSGHLVILQRLLGLTENGLAISVILHLGTAFALVVFFFKDLLELLSNPRMLLLLFLVTVITCVIGLAGKDFFESLFDSTAYVALGLMLTGITLILTRRFMRGERKALNLRDAIILGIAQSVAIIPGISRSGATISALLFRGLKKEEGMRISFLAAIPVIFAAAFLESRKIDLAFRQEWAIMLLGFVASFASGIIALKILKAVLKRARFYYFGYYCIIVAVAVLLFVK